MSRTIILAGETDFAGWRDAARRLCAAGVEPEAVDWRVGGDLFAPEPTPAAPAGAPVTAPRAFVDLADAVVLHRAADRFALLYRLLWRLQRRRDLLALRTDPDVARALLLARNVSRASHKMKAFVRFREIVGVDPETYVAWFEPAHRVVDKTAPHFVARFANLRFSILTPERCCHWDGETLVFTDGATRDQAPAEDALEDHWRAYYASIFNPARLKTRAMQSEMPKRYWRNLPEAALIPQLVEAAESRMLGMVAQEPQPTRRRLVERAGPAPAATPDGTLEALPAAIDACRRCDLWRDATQGVPGEGPAGAAIMLVGEQPGDQEDLAGRPFVGPAGQVLDRALTAAGIDRAQLFVTNAVRHFKHEPRGKRRLHKTPVPAEVTACRGWLEEERRMVAPRVIVALGATAALSVFGRALPILKHRGRPLPLEDGAAGLITVHPSYLLRLPDEAARAEGFAAFVEDLRAAASLAAEHRPEGGI